MVVVAVVGGTGNVGKTIVEAFIADGTHKVIVLGRKVPEGDAPAPTFAVDYNNVDQITQTLDENKVHTVISTISMYDGAAAQSERNIITAAEKAASVKRFVASGWGDKTPEDEALRIAPNNLREESFALLRTTSLEWTRFSNGIFLDYFGMPHVPSHLNQIFPWVDIAHRKAAIPGTTGDEVIVTTHTRDLAKFVVASLALENWDEELHCSSDRTTISKIVKLAEEATGDKFNVVYDSAEKLRKGEVTELPSHPYLYPYIPKPYISELFSKFGLWAIEGIMLFPQEGSLNEKFPEIKTMSVEEVVGAWKGH